MWKIYNKNKYTCLNLFLKNLLNNIMPILWNLKIMSGVQYTALIKMLQIFLNFLPFFKVFLELFRKCLGIIFVLRRKTFRCIYTPKYYQITMILSFEVSRMSYMTFLALEMAKITISVGQILTKNLNFWGHLYAFRAENTLKSRPFKAKNIA